METNGSNSSSHENRPSGGSNNSITEKPSEKEIFVNHGMSIKGKLVFVVYTVKSAFKDCDISCQSTMTKCYFGTLSNLY
jgi:hypothetical protein